MRVAKCDLCKKLVKGKPVVAGFGFLSGVEMCHKCGLPVLNFLEKHKLLDEEDIIKKRKSK